MELRIEKWKEFTVGKLFRIEPTKGVVSSDLEEGNDILYIAAKHEDNGFALKCKKDGFEDWVSKGNCIVFIQLGAGSAGYANYIPEDFIGMNGKTSCGYIDNVMTPAIGLFLEVILCQERPKYSFGRSWTGDRLKNTIIKLPIQKDTNGNPIIDDSCRYSENGYIPDWQFMEDYINSLNFKKVTTSNDGCTSPILDVINWKEYCIGDLFEILNGKGITQEEIAENIGDFNAIQSSEENNACMGKIDRQYCIDKGYTISDEPCLTVARSGSAGFVSFQPNGCVVGDSAKILLLKKSEHKNKHIYLFLRTVLMTNKYKYNYGRKVTANKYANEIIKLPTKNNEPDWQFMENYIKYLPYGDKI